MSALPPAGALCSPGAAGHRWTRGCKTLKRAVSKQSSRQHHQCAGVRPSIAAVQTLQCNRGQLRGAHLSGCRVAGSKFPGNSRRWGGASKPSGPPPAGRACQCISAWGIWLQKEKAAAPPQPAPPQQNWLKQPAAPRAAASWSVVGAPKSHCQSRLHMTHLEPV